jgi:DNA topoisomerase I
VLTSGNEHHAEGLITYHRTDGVAIADERCAAIRSSIASRYPDELPEKPIVYKSKTKNAQEAHDAITVTDPDVTASQISGTLTEKCLYDLIWRCTLACQMTNAQYKTVRFFCSLCICDTVGALRQLQFATGARLFGYNAVNAADEGQAVCCQRDLAGLCS